MPTTRRGWIGIAVVVIAVVLTGGAAVVLFSLMVDETHFARPDAGFDELGERVAAVDGVREVQKERWVEAPLFSLPSSMISVTADAGSLAEVVRVACTQDYRDAVWWVFDLETTSGSRVSLSSAGEVQGCPAFGFDPEPVVAELDRAAPGLPVQAAVWETGRFALSSLDATGMSDLIALVSRAEAVRTAAGLPADMPIEVAGSMLAVEIETGESTTYAELLTRLSNDLGATGFFAGGGGTPADGVERVQITAPKRYHAAIEAAIASSRLPIADLPVRFLSE